MKTVIAKFTNDNYANVYDVYQWDYGQVLRIEGLKLPNMVEIHFSLQETSGEAKTRIGVTKDGVTDVVIPDSFLENEGIGDNYKIFAWIYIADKDSGSTEYKITIHVKARAKPEITHGGQDGEVFQEAVEAVRDAAKRAAESEKQAEGYAHGREDIPERAEDNAMYYAGKASEDAKKTARDRAEVERLVESVSGIDEQVTKVEELSKNAQEAATQAGTSAGQAELHKQAAETASSAAQTAAQETEADKVSVEKLSAQVQKNKKSVDKTAQDFALNTQQALADVNNAGQAQTERVQTAGTTAVENIKTAQDTATRAVETAKTEAVKAVQTEGTAQTGAVAAEGEKQVQAVQAAAQEIIADREQIQKNKTDIADLRQNKADAIVENVRGTLLNVKDSANALFEDFSMYGKTEQIQTTGANLIDYSKHKVNIEKNVEVKYDCYNITIKNNNNYPISVDFPIKLGAGNYYLSSASQMNAAVYKENKWFSNGILNSMKGSFNVTESGEYCVKINVEENSSTTIKKLMCSKTEEAVYEPYTGDKPSPSPEYPQEPVNAGRLNLDTEKYEIEIKVTGKNIFNVEKLNDKWNVGVNYYYIPLFVGKGSRVSFSVSKKLTTGLKVYALFSKEFGGNEKAYSWIYHSSEEGLIKAKGTFTAETDVISLSFAGDKDILINELFNYLQVEISETPTSYEPYKEQTLTLTSDRPLTKWDRLVEQEGQIGWLYGSKSYKVTGKESFESREGYNTDSHTNRFFILSDLPMDKSILRPLAYVKKLKYVLYCYAPNIKEEGFDTNSNQFHIKLSNDRVGILASDDSTVRTSKFSEYMKKIYEDGKPIELLYMTTDTTFTPLPQEQQEAIRALQTYYPTTVVSNSEDAEMQLSYVADTKNYTDRKIEQAVSAQTQNLANLLSLMPLSTQAAMIEADTNNILDMEVQK